MDPCNKFRYQFKRAKDTRIDWKLCILNHLIINYFYIKTCLIKFMDPSQVNDLENTHTHTQ
jgi:hypothetical protein